MWKSLPKWAQKNALAADQGGTWLPGYLTWDGPTLTALRCWKCRTDLVGWRVMLDQYGHLVERNGKQCLWLRGFDHYTSTPVTVRWGRLNRLAIFDALHCKDCRLDAADLPMLVTIFLAGHALLMEYGWDHHLPLPMGKHAWATYLYRWSDDANIQCEPLGLNYVTKETAVNLPTAGKPMGPADYLQWSEALQGGRFYPGMVMTFKGETPPPGWKWEDPRHVSIEKL
jgi:hypothetical protein